MRLLSASNRAPNSVWRSLAASCWMAMLALGAAAQTAPWASAQTHDPAITTRGVTGSAPQTGSSAYTSGRAFKAQNAEQGAPAPVSQAKPIAQGVPPAEQTAKAAKPPAAKILVLIDKPTQEMKVFVDGAERYERCTIKEFGFMPALANSRCRPFSNFSSLPFGRSINNQDVQ